MKALLSHGWYINILFWKSCFSDGFLHLLGVVDEKLLKALCYCLEQGCVVHVCVCVCVLYQELHVHVHI